MRFSNGFVISISLSRPRAFEMGKARLAPGETTPLPQTSRILLDRAPLLARATVAAIVLSVSAGGGPRRAP
jgi:hypothetical protein